MLSLKRAESNPVRKSAHPQYAPTTKAVIQETPSQIGLGPDVVQRQEACTCGGGCPRCIGVQAKLKVNSPGDRYEQEADRIADQVMRMPESAVVRESVGRDVGEMAEKAKPEEELITPVLQRQAEDPGRVEDDEELKLMPEGGDESLEEEDDEDNLQRQEVDEELEEEETLQLQAEEEEPDEEEEERPVQRQALDEDEEDEEIQAKPHGGSVPRVSTGLEGRIRGLKGGGEPLPASERHFFEPRLGGDLRSVRVHTSSAAQEMAGALKARAFTPGTNNAFGAGQFAPGTVIGRRLLAHELVHVLQRVPGIARQGAGARGQRRVPVPNRRRLINRIWWFITNKRKLPLIRLLRSQFAVLKGDSEVISIFRRRLVGDDQWYCLGLLHYGNERNWPFPNQHKPPNQVPNSKGKIATMLRTWRDGVRQQIKGLVRRGVRYNANKQPFAGINQQGLNFITFIRAVFLHRGDRDYFMQLALKGSERFWDPKVVREFSGRRDLQVLVRGFKLRKRWVPQSELRYQYRKMRKTWRKGRWVRLSYMDIKQGALGDCWFLAALAAIAKINPRFIDRMIKIWRNGTVTVYFRDPRNGRVRGQVTILPGLPVWRSNLIYARRKERRKLSGYWVAILEKAYAKWKSSGRGYPTLHGGYPLRAMRDLLGGGTNYNLGIFNWCANRVTRVGRMALNRIRSLITNALRNKQPAVVDDYCKPSCANAARQRNARNYYKNVYLRDARKKKFQGCHGYAVIEIKGNRVKLYDPHGWLFTVTTQDLVDYCDDLTIGHRIRWPR